MPSLPDALRRLDRARVRKLTPKQDRLDLLTLELGDWNRGADSLGALARPAHRGGGTDAVWAACSKTRAAYLAYSETGARRR